MICCCLPFFSRTSYTEIISTEITSTEVISEDQVITPSRFSTARDRVDLFLTQINSADNGIRVEAFSYLKNSIVKDVSLMQGRKREFEILGCPLDSLSQRRFKIQLEETTDGMKIFIDGKFKKIISGLTFSDFSSY